MPEKKRKLSPYLELLTQAKNISVALPSFPNQSFREIGQGVHEL